jgi:protein-disulfide isomerase
MKKVCFLILFICIANTTLALAKQNLDQENLKKNITKRVVTMLSPKFKEMKSYSPDNVLIDQVIPVKVGKDTYYAIKAILTPAVKNQKEGKLTMLVDHTGSFQFSGLMDIASGENPSEMAMAEIDKVELPENFGSVVNKGSGTREITLVSDPFCPYCRTAWSFLTEQKDKYKEFSLVHMPLSFHVGADASCWLLAYVEENHPDKIFEVANWAYSEFQAPREQDLEKAREKVIASFLEKFPWLTTSKASEFGYFLKGKYEEVIAGEIEAAQEMEIGGTPAIFIDGIRIDGFDQKKIESVLSM